MHVPWRRVASWHCSACGRCCSAYRVKLNAYEYLKLKPTGFVEEKAGRFYIKKIGNRCPFQLGRLCMLQNRLKPVACRIFPFSLRRDGHDEALFEYGEEEYYVYVDTFCPNVKIKKDRKPSKDLIPLIIEAIKIHKREMSGVNLLTASLGTGAPQQHRLRFLMA